MNAKYLNELIAGRGNGLVKIITGVRRCGKSFLLFDIWHNWLLAHGIADSHIIEIQLDDFRNRPPYRVYIQSAFHMPSPEKEVQERRPLLSINDHFRKIVIVGDDIHRKEDELGVMTIGLLDFLTDKKLLEQG